MSNQNQTNQQREEYWKLYTLEFPGGKRIRRARVLSRTKDSWVVIVEDLYKKEGKVIAECELEHRGYGLVFVTRYDHYGHLDLCRWIKKQGIGGNYTDYLRAVEDGWTDKDWDEEDAAEIRDGSEISFKLIGTNATPEEWEITLTLNEEGEEETYTL